MKPLRNRGSRGHRALAALAAGLLASPVVLVAAATGAQAAPNCPQAYPVGQVKAGMKAWGLTVSKGTKPEKFDVEVEGVLKDGIAPGIDMIIAEAHSPAIDKAGAIWAGMSGSPVYAPDGRILGAVGYGFSGSSQLAGITPAAAMLDILKRPDQVKALKAGTKAKLPEALRRKLTKQGLVTAAQADGGLSAILEPRAVSGLSQQRIGALNAALAKKGSSLRYYRSSSASGRTAPTSAVVPGGNFGALQAYGDVTLGGIGTTTLVCDGKALAFGHPFLTGPFGNPLPGGAVKLTATDGEAIAIVKDPVFSPYKMANLGGVVGTLTQDRHAGIAAKLGVAPPVTPIKATATAGGSTLSGTSYVNRGDDVPLVSNLQLWSTLDHVRDQITGGTSTSTWTVKGTAAGKPWQVTLSDKFADQADATGAAGSDINDRLSALQNNPFTAVRFTDLRLTAKATTMYGKYTVRRLLIKKAGKWVAQRPDQALKVTAGSTVVVRAELAAFRAPTKTVDISLTVPKKPKGTSGTVTVSGGTDLATPSLQCLLDVEACPEELRPKNFADLAKKLQDVPRNDDLYGTLALAEDTNVKVTKHTRLDQVVSGTFAFPITIG